MEKINLFPSLVWKTKIDPTSYDRDGLLQVINRNYETDPDRNNTDGRPTWNLHHYMYDWENEQFETLDRKPLVEMYGKIIAEFIRGLNLTKEVKYRYSITDITASANGQNLREHDHFYRDENFESVFSCVHYIKFNKDKHPPTWFKNPLVFSQYNENTKHMRQIIDRTDLSQSCYYEEWSLPVEENDFVIFPAWLKHGAHETKTDELRVVCVINLEFEIDTKKWLT